MRGGRFAAEAQKPRGLNRPSVLLPGTVGSPVWFLYVVLLALFALRRHPPTLLDEDEIGWGRVVVAVLVVVIFLLSFLPFPITFEG